MNRVEFTKITCKILSAMFLDGEFPIMDYVKRSDEEQYRLWQIGRDQLGNKMGKTVTDCDGIHIISPHQRGRAIDIYFYDPITEKLGEPKRGFDYWHQVWESYGGKPKIDWDLGHFEV